MPLFQAEPTRKAAERPCQTQQERPIADRVRLRYLSEMSEKQGAKNDPPSVLAARLDRGRRSKETEIHLEKAKEQPTRIKGCGDNPCCFRSLYFVPLTATNRLCWDCSARSGTFFRRFCLRDTGRTFAQRLKNSEIDSISKCNVLQNITGKSQNIRYRCENINIDIV